MKTRITEHAKKLLAFILCLSMLLSCYPVTSYGITDFSVPAKITIPQAKLPVRTEPIRIDASASQWAVPELSQAYEYGLTYPGIMDNFTKPINREEFCTIVVKLYEKLSGKAVPPAERKFIDTENPEVDKANQLGIVYGTGGGKFSPNNPITRQEISVMLFRALGAAIPGLDESTNNYFNFADQDQIAPWALEAMKFASSNRILNGIGGNKIAPLMNTTREQAIAILKRTYEQFGDTDAQIIGSVGQNKEEDGQRGESSGQIIKPIENVPGIPSGLSNIGGKDINTELTGPDEKILVVTGSKPSGSSEVAVIAPGFKQKIPSDIVQGKKKVPGTDIAVKMIDATVMVGSSIKQKAPSEEEKALLFERDNKLAYPDYDTRLSLTAAMGEGKQSARSSAHEAALIDQDGDKKRWFFFNLADAPGAVNVVWQVSTAPFNGTKSNWKKPLGLVKSGQVSAQSGEFQVDFAAFAPTKTNLHSYKIGPGGVLTWGGDKIYREIPTSRKTYYVRAVPVDAAGNCIGDPGQGMAVLYGKPITDISTRSLTLNPSFELWSAMQEGKPYTGTEFPNLFEHKTSRFINCHNKQPSWFQVKELDAAATQVVIQVSTKPFTGKVGNWESPDGLAYSKSYKLPVSLTGDEFPNAMPVDFASFSPPSDSFKPGEGINYYLRAVALSPSSGAGNMAVAFSETVTILYGNPNPVIWMQQQTYIAKSYIPDIKILRYQPIKRESPEWQYHYQVFRAPKWNEITCNYKNQAGYVLKPYAWYIYHYEEAGLSEAPTPEKYETEIIPQILPVGARLEIRPKEEDSSFWGELWEAS